MVAVVSPDQEQHEVALVVLELVVVDNLDFEATHDRETAACTASDVMEVVGEMRFGLEGDDSVAFVVNHKHSVHPVDYDCVHSAAC